LALHAGRDLGFFARWRTERHLKRCSRCQDDLAAFENMREILPALGEMPEIPWNRLAAEMRANIRLGLEAGACVQGGEEPGRRFVFGSPLRTALACASVTLVVCTGLILQAPTPAKDHAPVLAARANGVQLTAGNQMQGLTAQGPVGSVSYSQNAQGSIGATYVDPEGYLTQVTMYGQ
jgi:hypothetical protein